MGPSQAPAKNGENKMHQLSKFILATSFTLVLTGTGSFSGFSDFKARLLGVDEEPVATEMQTEVDITDDGMTSTTPEPIQTDDASSTTTITNEFNTELVNESVTVTEITGGHTVTVTHNESTLDDNSNHSGTPSSAFTRFRARFNF